MHTTTKAIILASLILAGSLVYSFRDPIRSELNQIRVAILKPSKIDLKHPKVITSTIDTWDWKTFEGNGFTLKYPKDWKYFKNEMNPESQFAFSNVNIMIKELAGGDAVIELNIPDRINIKGAPPQSFGELKEFYAKFDQVNYSLGDSIDLVMINGVEALDFHYGGLFPHDSLAIPVENGQHFLTLSLSVGPNTTKNDYLSLLQVLHAILLTVKFK